MIRDHRGKSRPAGWLALRAQPAVRERLVEGEGETQRHALKVVKPVHVGHDQLYVHQTSELSLPSESAPGTGTAFALG